MHEILTRDPAVAAVDQQIADLAKAEKRWNEKVDKVRREHAQACRDADASLEPRPPQPPQLIEARGPNFMYERHELSRQRRLAIGFHAEQIAAALVARHDQVMTELQAALQPALALAAEIQSLHTSYGSVVSGQRTYLNETDPHHLPGDPALLPALPEGRVSRADILDAAIRGERLIPQLLEHVN
jgi:hypothetical protein